MHTVGEADAADPELLARRLHMIYHGASLSGRLDRNPAATAMARGAAEALLDAACR